MSDRARESPSSSRDIGEYCRRVEGHLTKVNGGHLVRVVGPGFLLVRGWAEEGIPLSVVFRAIEQKAERHTAGASRRPLRIEFCESDVRDLFENWRRAIGLHGEIAAAAGEGDAEQAETGAGAGHRTPSLSRHLERATDRLVRVTGRLEFPDAFRARVTRVLEQVAELREAARTARGAARAPLVAPLAGLDEELAAAARASTPADVLAELTRDAEVELAPFRARLAGDAWERSVARTIDRLLRDRYALPILDLIT